MLRKPDLDRARDDLATFGKLTGRSLAKFQSAALTLEARTTYVLGPRQAGKSRSAALVAAWRAFREPGHHVLIVSASDLGAKRLLAMVAEIVTGSSLLAASLVDEQASLIRLTNGSTIRSVPSSVKAIRGWSIDTLIFDEATELGDEIIDVALPTVAARPHAKVIFLSTGGAPVGRAFETYMAGLDPRSDYVRAFKWALKDARWISAGAIEHARLTMPPWRFQMEYEAGWAGAIDALFTPDVLRACSGDFELPDLDHLSGPARILGGCDWAASGPDQSAVVAIARIPNPEPGDRPLFVCWPLRLFPVGHAVTEAARQIAYSPARWEVLSFETNGVGAGPSQILREELTRRRRVEQATYRMDGEDLRAFEGAARRTNPTFTTWERKADALGRLKVLAEGGQLLFARHEQFQRQLASVRVEHRQHSVGIEAPPGGFDDLVDSLYIASGSWGNGREIRNVLAHLARQPVADEVRLPPSEDVIEVGGRELPRRPPLLSVAGPEISLPAGQSRAESGNPILEKARRALAAARAEGSTDG